MSDSAGQLRQTLRRELGRFTDVFQRQHWAMQLASMVGGIAATAVLANAVFTSSAYAPPASGVQSAPPYGFGIDIVAQHPADAAVQPQTIEDPETSSPYSEVVPGDVNVDGKIDSVDYSILLSHYGGNYPPADVDKNGVIDSLDMATLLANWSW